MTDYEIISNANLYFAASTETVMTVLMALTYLVIRGSRVMAKLAAEIRDKLPNKISITIKGFSHLEYLTACIREALRKYPPIAESLPAIVPRAGQRISRQRILGGVRCLFELLGMYWVNTNVAQTFIDGYFL